MRSSIMLVLVASLAGCGDGAGSSGQVPNVPNDARVTDSADGALGAADADGLALDADASGGPVVVVDGSVRDASSADAAFDSRTDVDAARDGGGGVDLGMTDLDAGADTSMDSSFVDGDVDDGDVEDGPASLPCDANRWDDDANPFTPCVPHSRCAPGEYVLEEATATSDRVCVGCDSGTFSAEENASFCEPWSECEAGTFVAAEGSSSADRACEPCEAGTFSAEANQALCTAAEACPAGTVQTRAATFSSPAECAACEAGEHCPGADFPARPCGVEGDGTNTWDHDADPATACIAQTNCVDAFYVQVAGDELSDRVCAQCEEGTFSAVFNAVSCEPFTECAPGSFVFAAGSSRADRVCAPCAARFYSAGANADSCLRWTDCSPGSRMGTPGTAVSDRVCVPCEPGTFSARVNNTRSCRAFTECGPGEEEQTPGTATSDRVCQEIDSCDPNPCSANGDTDAVCVDEPAPAAGYRCECSSGSTTRDFACPPPTCESGAGSCD
ncbi:MAG: hypothetical protein AAF938_07960 [Myxococcota bacterium]